MDCLLNKECKGGWSVAKFIEGIPIICLMVVTLFSQNIIGPYLIGKGLIPKETAVVAMYGIAAFAMGFFPEYLISKYLKKRDNSKK